MPRLSPVTYDIDETWDISLEFLDSMKIRHFLIRHDKCFYYVILLVIYWRRQIKYFSLTSGTSLVYKDKETEV